MAGERVAIIGASGSGKSTLLHLLGGLDVPTRGEVRVVGQRMTGLSEAKRGQLRNQTMGFVYQFHHLLPEFNAEENIILPQLITGKSFSKAKERAHNLLKEVGLKERALHRPARLSGGEQQRVALVRALANSPQVLLADEPTGNLDEHTSSSVFQTLLKLVRQDNLAALIATHNIDLAKQMDRIVVLHEGHLHVV